mmetsp:Transcript_27892/g.42228  ORF Transcript_27892/g.42228 Transcript_27892/m.42228 type:complete len:82 (-) Transcript_27892:809-1054(-)
MVPNGTVYQSSRKDECKQREKTERKKTKPEILVEPIKCAITIQRAKKIRIFRVLEIKFFNVIFTCFKKGQQGVFLNVYTCA